jgi:hypothetical protein
MTKAMPQSAQMRLVALALTVPRPAASRDHSIT